MGNPVVLRVLPHQSILDGKPVTVEVDLDDTTLLELRYQLFSLTDIPPESIYLHLDTTIIHPNDETDGSRSLLHAGILDSSSLFYSNSLTTESSEMQSKQSISLEDVQRALRQRLRISPSRSPADPATKEFLARVQKYRDAILTYEDEALHEKALKVIPVGELHILAKESFTKKEHPTFRHALFKQLLHWFKHSFYKWVDKPECWSCGKETKLVDVLQPSPSEAKYKASRTELFRCVSCGAESRFPRYNDVGKLLETRKGRCGEWAQTFTLSARALGFRVRAVHDWTDHVWTEVYLPDDVSGRWIHADSCEDIMDEPLLYEQGWGKKLNYCIATGVDVVLDVTKKYTNDFDKLKERRTLADEGLLQSGLRTLHEETLARRDVVDRRAADARYAKELAELNGQGRTGTDVELPGRQSGSAAWVEARGEDGGRNKSGKERD